MKNQKNKKIEEKTFKHVLNNPNADYFVYGVQAAILAAFKPTGW